MAISTGDIIKVAARIVFNAVADQINTWWIRCTNDNGLALPDAIDDLLNVVEDIYDVMDTDLVNNCTFADMDIFNYTQDEAYGAWDWPTLVAGANINSAMPPGCAVFAYMPTIVPRCRARKWFSGWGEGHADEGLWGAALLAVVANGLLQSMGTQTGPLLSTWEFVVPHFYENKLPVTPPEFLGYSDWTISANPGYQRRRRVGSGS